MLVRLELVESLCSKVGTHSAIVRAKTSGFFELMLTQPVRRAQWFWGLLLARVAALIGAARARAGARRGGARGLLAGQLPGTHPGAGHRRGVARAAGRTHHQARST
ncbi:hypothetical protein MXAN_5396 [Myxococcus xanthus DK 1622]|uniref:Uncharacterized protein n=1 Tax=Myxococcus xanthus (strain DK1622) TaxID=246197 RepID=Q1D1D0_MYXXD|nr:hypothetical protein MXAN_5396 [Myxococcus xanthus DK 1622]